jgi:hypothetical protein
MGKRPIKAVILTTQDSNKLHLNQLVPKAHE